MTPFKPFSQERLNKVRQAAIREAATRPAKREMAGGDGRLVRRVPAEAYYNAKVAGEDVNSEGYWKDMERLYPEIAVAHTSTRIGVSLAGRSRVTGPRLTRYGRVTFHKSYRTHH